MKCPIDGNDLKHQVYEADIEVEKCEICNGIWLDYQELENIQDTFEHNYSTEISKLPDLVGQAYAVALAKAEPTHTCPHCEKKMERREYGSCSQVMVDVCPHCRGVWLDNGEVEALEIFFEKARYETAQMRSGFFSRLKDLFD